MSRSSIFAVTGLFLCACFASTITVRTKPEGARIVMNGQDLGPSPIAFIPNADRLYEIEVSSPGYQSRALRIADFTQTEVLVDLGRPLSPSNQTPDGGVADGGAGRESAHDSGTQDSEHVTVYSTRPDNVRPDGGIIPGRRMRTDLPHEIGSDFQSSEGYQQVRWGMHRKQVQRLYPRASGDKGRLVMSSRVAGFEAVTAFLFVQDFLTDVVVSIRPGARARSERDAYDALVGALTKVYDDPSDQGGDLSLWITDKSRILLKYNPLSVLTSLTITYSSLELESIRENASTTEGL